jgi:hypothetical protein
MTDSVSAARAMIEAATTAGTTLMVGESYHFHATHQLAHTLVQAGEIGVVREIEMWKGGWQCAETARAAAMRGGPRAPAGSAAAWRSHPELSGVGAFPWTIDHGMIVCAPRSIFNQPALLLLLTLSCTHRKTLIRLALMINRGESLKSMH